MCVLGANCFRTARHTNRASRFLTIFSSAPDKLHHGCYSLTSDVQKMSLPVVG
jgi:hypothetical protein